MSKKLDNVLQAIGNTPIIRINRMAPEGVNLYVKAEAFNPMGSVKDRLALGVIEDAERRGVLKPGQTVVEGTSGNTGIGLAMVCAQKGYPLVVTMAENFSVERRRLMRFLGAQVVLTPASDMGSGMMAKAMELAEQNGWFLCHQFENEANADTHSNTTAQEILAAFDGEALDYWVTGYGTGGTLKGVARVLKDQRPDTRVVVCEPDNSPLLTSGIIQSYRDDGTPAVSHRGFRPHLMQGWTPDFIPKLTNDAQQQHLIDDFMPIAGKDALRCSRELARKEGLFTGITGGATLAGALQVCANAEPGSTVLCMLPDTGERYMSTVLFEDIDTEMSEQEMAISRSTPGYRFDVEGGAADDEAEEETPVAVEPEMVEFVEQVVNDAQQPVVMFAMEWCEFCWSVRKMFDHFGIAYRSIDIDSVEYKQDNRGGRIKAALMDRTEFITIPQIFVGGQFVGGCTDIFDAYKDGSLAPLLSNARIELDPALDVDPYQFLPTWLHAR